MSLLSEGQVLVTSCYKTSLYEIPPLQIISPGQNSPVIQQEPIWTHTYQDKYNYPPVGPVCWDAASGRHESPLAMLTGTTLRFFTPAPTPAQPPSMDSFLVRTYSTAATEARPALSDRRAIWSAEGRLFVCAFPVRPGGEAGRLRLGGAVADTMHVASVEMPAGAVDGQIQDLSWDEAAGRLCLLVESQRMGSKPPSLKIILVDAI